MIKYLVFDFDGTMVDSLDIMIEVYNRIAEKYKAKKLHHQDLEYFKGLSVKERCKFLNFKLYKFPLAALDIYRLSKPYLEDLRFFPGIQELIEQLHACGYKLAIISTNSEHNIRSFLKRSGIDFIQEVICSNNIFGKDKDIKFFLKTRELKNSEVVYVGDEVRDIIACQKNRIRVIWVSWGYDRIDNAQKLHPDSIVHTPQEILDYLQILNEPV